MDLPTKKGPESLEIKNMTMASDAKNNLPSQQSPTQHNTNLDLASTKLDTSPTKTENALSLGQAAKLQMTLKRKMKKKAAQESDSEDDGKKLTYEDYNREKQKHKLENLQKYSQKALEKVPKVNYKAIAAKVWTNNEEFHRKKEEKIRQQANKKQEEHGETARQLNERKTRDHEHAPALRIIHPEAIIAEKNNAAIQDILKAKKDRLTEDSFTSRLKIVTGENGALM